jgi:hypothetical protein
MPYSERVMYRDFKCAGCGLVKRQRPTMGENATKPCWKCGGQMHQTEAS